MLGLGFGRASGEWSWLDHPEGKTESTWALYTSHSSLSSHFLQLLLEPTLSWAARAKLEVLLPMSSLKAWGMSFGGSLGPHLPAPKVLDPSSTPFSLRPLPSLPHHRPAGAPPRPLATLPAKWLVMRFGLYQAPTPPPCQPIKRVVLIVPPFIQGICMRTLKPNP